MNESPDSNRTSTVSKSQTALLIVWGAMLMGEFTFLMVILRFHLAKPHDHPPESQKHHGVGLFCDVRNLYPSRVFHPFADLQEIRAQIGKDFERGLQRRQHCFMGELRWRCFFAMVVAMQSGTFWPTGVCLGIAVAVQILTSPLGKQFEPQSTP